MCNLAPGSRNLNQRFRGVQPVLSISGPLDIENALLSSFLNNNSNSIGIDRHGAGVLADKDVFSPCRASLRIEFNMKMHLMHV